MRWILELMDGSGRLTYWRIRLPESEIHVTSRDDVKIQAQTHFHDSQLTGRENLYAYMDDA